MHHLRQKSTNMNKVFLSTAMVPCYISYGWSYGIDDDISCMLQQFCCCNAFFCVFFTH